ncbi:MAG: SURF1 family protein [Maritimibacter sp.]
MFRQIAAILFLVAGFAVFVSLGVWQLQRLQWKEGVLAEINTRIASAPVALPAHPTKEHDPYLPVQISGQFEAAELFVLVSSRDFGPGFRLISPFITEDGRRVMVDRGFIPTAERDRERSFGAADIIGNLHWPDERDRFTPADDSEGNWWYARDVAKMAAALGTEPLLVIAKTKTDPDILPLPVTTEGIRNKHFEYAMTWFLFAATWVVMTGFALWRIRRRNS